MPSFRTLCQLLGLVSAVSALPAINIESLTAASRSSRLSRRQEAGGITDVDILQFALTAEHLESAFYNQGFQKFPADQFKALGLNDDQVKALVNVGQTEAEHVSFLLSAIAGAGIKPVAPCEYEFGFTDAASMVKTARVLEAVGVSAYLGAAPLIKSPEILGAAATIATIESRHQTFIRGAAGAEPVPAAFDVPLGPRAVFTLAAGFIKSCPQGSSLNIPPFPAIALSNAEGAGAGTKITLGGGADLKDAKNCAFLGPGRPQFVEFKDGGCEVPQGLAGEVYMMVTKSPSAADDQVIAGPSVLSIS